MCSRESLGARNVLWLGRGIAGDDTHGHVDDLCRFVGTAAVLLCQEPDPADDQLTASWKRTGRGWRASAWKMAAVPGLRVLPMPSPLFHAGQRLPASYANFYIANGTVLVPTFNDPMDRAALGILADLFPGRAVVGIHAVDLVWGLGTLHCLTQQEPAD